MAVKAKKGVWPRMRLKNAMMRLFTAAKSEEFWSSWGKSVTTIDQAIHDDWESLVARSREQYANNGYVKRFVNLCQTNIVGEQGVSVQSTVVDARNVPDVAVQRLIESEWANFSQSVTPCGMSRADFESLVIQGCAIDGEVFVRPIVSKSARYGVQFTLVDPILCPVWYHDSDKNIRHGIEYDKSGKPIAYYFSDAPIKRSIWSTQMAQMGEKLTRVSASQIWHIFLPEWVGQKRGVPWVAGALGQLKNIDGYVEAAILNARVGATKMGFFETTGSGEYVGEEDALGNLVMEAEPGSFEVLPEGLKLSTWNPDYPHQQFGEFLTANLKCVAATLGVANHSLTGDMSGVNYSSARIASLDERDMWKMKQAWLIHRLVRPMFEIFITYSIDMGKLSFNGNPMREQPEHYFAANYQGRRWQWVDPQKEVVGAKEAVSMNTKSLSDIIREQGKDPETVWREIAKERQMLDSLGISYETMRNEVTQPEVANNDSND